MKKRATATFLPLPTEYLCRCKRIPRGSLVLAATFASIAHAAPGQLDPTFNGTGTARVGFGPLLGEERAYAAAAQADGKLLVAGYTELGFSERPIAIVRYNPDGSRDSSFGNDGVVITFIAGYQSAAAAALAVQADGRIVLAGNVGDGSVVVRYNPDGSLDPTFDDDGIALLPGTNQYVKAMKIQADGKIVVGGTSNVRFFVARYNGNGLLDPSFGSAGKVITPFVSNAEVNALAIQGDGKILAAGSTLVNSSDDFALARYNGDGSLDMSFGTGGKVITPVSSSYDWANAVAIQTGTPTTPDKIVAAGTAFNGSTYDAALVRYNLDGSLDTTFGTGGQVLTPVGPGEDVATALLVTGSGLQLRKIMVAGYSATTTDFVPPHQFSLLRYNADGSLDTSFNGTGKVTTPIGGDAFATTLTISNGKFFAAGYTHPIGNLSAFDFALARYNTDGSLDSSFDLDGKKTDDIGSASPVAVLATAIQSDGRIVLAGGGNLAPNSPGFVLARLNANGTLDTSFNGTGKVTTQLDSGAAASGLVIQSDGKLLVTGTTYNGSTYNIALARYNSDGSLDGSFGSGGKVITTLGVVASPRAVAIQPGTFGEPDRIVVAIDFPGASSTRRFALMRYRLDGSIDPTFGFAGLVTNQTFEEASTANPQSFVYSLVIQCSGPSVRKIIVAGSARSSPSAETPAFALARYDPNGSLDSSFGIGGKVITPIRERSGAFSVVLQAGKIVAAGYSGLASSDDDFAVVRYNDDGSFDPSFGSGGSITTPIAVGLDDTARALAIQSNGRIVLAGYSGSGQYGGDDFAVVRYNSDGSLDGSYGIGGKVLLDVDGSEDRTFALALDAAGRAVVAGTSRQLFGVARLLGEVRLEIFSITGHLDGHIVLDGLGVPGAINHIEASPDLSLGSFTNIGTVVPDANALFEFEDPDAPLFSRRFYRLSFP